MQGDERVLEFLNEQLSAELTAINQYFLHARMQHNLGWVKLAAHTRAESIDEMRHAETLTERYPTLIYARGHGYGARGPDADAPGYDASAFWARGGMAQASFLA